MGNSPCDPNKDDSKLNDWLGVGITVYGAFMSAVQSFSLTKVAGASSSVAKMMINTVGLLRDISLGAASGAEGQDNAANGIASELVGGIITASIVFSITSLDFFATPVVAAVLVGIVSIFATSIIDNFLKRHENNFYDPL